MNFGEAIEEIKEGSRVQRSGWNGKGMHIYLEDKVTAVFGKGGMQSDRTYPPVIVMFTAQGHHQVGWLASQADILAEDWQVVE